MNTTTTKENEMTDTTYNGWVNNSTWRANLWLSNEPRLYEQALKRTAFCMERGWSPDRTGELLCSDLKHEFQRLLGRGETAMYFEFCPEDGDAVIPEVDREELGESWIATVLDHRAHGEVI